ncbi:hypothetical protein CBZ_03980 [Cellulomonas biazotea]|uniref:Uncharacterized protein n=1 Tax=Cellulomonas biazotea TaxID=1709 RepID=A0A402DMJ0_9CELL|nr:hypothetical protein CBZ_03980 [Cellulomonas biazotea]
MTVAGWPVPAAAIAGVIPATAKNDETPTVATATQADRRRVVDDIVRTFLVCGRALAASRGRAHRVPCGHARDGGGGARRSGPAGTAGSATMRASGDTSGRTGPTLVTPP